MRRSVAGCLLLLAPLAPLAPLALGACTTVDRPEGVVERWLTSINQGPTGEPERYAEEALSEEILPSPREAGGLDVIEVGKGAEEGGRARIPYRVARVSGEAMHGVAELERSASGEWMIVRLSPEDPTLLVPTGGGERIGRATPVVWVGSVAGGLLLVVMVFLTMRLVGTPPVNSAPRRDP